MLVLRHQRHGREHLDAGLADREHMGAGTHRLEETEEMVDIFIEAEAPGFRRYVAGVVPVGDEDVMLRQQGLDRVAQQGGEMPRERRHDQPLVAGRRTRPCGSAARWRRGDEDLSSDTATWRRAPLAPNSSTEEDGEGRPLMAELGTAEHFPAGGKMAPGAGLGEPRSRIAPTRNGSRSAPNARAR